MTSTIYNFTRQEVLDALELLIQMPVLKFQNYDELQKLIALGRSTTIDLPDLLIGLIGKSLGCETTLDFEKRLSKTELFEQL